ncbi:hypothetical protein BDR05DRAFT_507039 [Suillus weaverae]|nr:hypothetical protein BDR05DRAFT_507039 [Suillus weaverae]
MHANIISTRPRYASRRQERKGGKQISSNDPKPKPSPPHPASPSHTSPPLSRLPFLISSSYHLGSRLGSVVGLSPVERLVLRRCPSQTRTRVRAILKVNANYNHTKHSPSTPSVSFPSSSQ